MFCNAKEFLAWQRQLRGEGEGSKRAMRDLLRLRATGDSMKFAGGPASLGQNQDRGISPVIWDNFKLTEQRANPSVGSFFFDDFLHFGSTTAANVIKAQSQGSYIGRTDSTSSIKMSNAFLPGDKSKANGVIELVTPASTASLANLEAGDGNGGAWGLTGNAYPKLAFECRVYCNMTTLTGFDTFFGMAEKGLGVTAGAGSIIGTGDTVNQKSFIGFYSLTAAPTNIIPAYGKNAVAPVPVTNGFNAGVGTLASKTWTKLGWIYDPMPHDGYYPPGLLKFYQDGKLLGWVTDCSISAFPTTKLLTLLMNVQNDAAIGTATTFDIDWIAAGVQVDA